MLGITREEQSNLVELKFFRGTTGANVAVIMLSGIASHFATQNGVLATQYWICIAVHCDTSCIRTPCNLIPSPAPRRPPPSIYCIVDHPAGNLQQQQQFNGTV